MYNKIINKYAKLKCVNLWCLELLRKHETCREFQTLCPSKNPSKNESQNIIFT